jgi:hypothetical protein
VKYTIIFTQCDGRCGTPENCGTIGTPLLLDQFIVLYYNSIFHCIEKLAEFKLACSTKPVYLPFILNILIHTPAF